MKANKVHLHRMRWDVCTHDENGRNWAKTAPPRLSRTTSMGGGDALKAIASSVTMEELQSSFST